MTSDQFSATLARLGLNQSQAASLLGVSRGAVTRWAQGTRQIPGPVARLVWLLDQRAIGSDVRQHLNLWEPPVASP